jgi:hypothetical protein
LLCEIPALRKKIFYWIPVPPFSLLPHQSDAAATRPKLQSVQGQLIKTWNFVNTRVEFNGWERKLAFLQADVPFPIICLDFFRFFGMQVDPSSSEVLVAPPSSLSGRRHRQLRQQCRKCVFFGPARGIVASA